MIAPWYVMAYTKLDRIAWRHGYALALHGSMARDLDLIAVPWTDDADAPEKLLESIRRFIVAGAGKNVSTQIPMPHKKPHGRIAYAFPVGYDGHYLDVSIMPRQLPGIKTKSLWRNIKMSDLNEIKPCGHSAQYLWPSEIDQPGTDGSQQSQYCLRCAFEGTKLELDEALAENQIYRNALETIAAPAPGNYRFDCPGYAHAIDIAREAMRGE